MVHTVEEYSFDQQDRQFLFNFSQFILYCRGVYKITNVYNDIKKVLSITTGKNTADITNKDVMEVAVKVFLCINRRNNPQLLYQTVNPFADGADSVNHEQYLLNVLKGISKAKISFPLQKPNYNILPQAQVEKK